jgi:predicted nucleotidyltransferase component of viral defense system
MISSETIKELATKNQTTETNIVREYVQNLFLKHFYSQDNSGHVLFKGGTALRLIHESPRYSEDLDFNAPADKEDLEHLTKKTLLEMNREGLGLKMTESKKTSGGYLGIIEGVAGEWTTSILINISTRAEATEPEPAMITCLFMPPYLISALQEDSMVEEKISALLQRTKPRDFFDLYFILRKGMSKKTVASHRSRLIKEVEKIDDQKIARELKVFLPKSFWPIIRNLREHLMTELQRR